MPLTLRILSYRNQPVPQAPTGYFAEAGGTLGRSPDNALVLDDPGKYVSRVHAQVLLRGGAYFLEDVGSNPSVVNDRPLGKGREIQLADGDRITIGDYQLEARLTEAAPAAPVLPPAPFNDTALPLFEPPPPPAPVQLPPFDLMRPAPAHAAPVPDAAPVDALAGADILKLAPADGGGLFDDPLGLGALGTPAVTHAPKARSRKPSAHCCAKPPPAPWTC
ncbi:type VI secretion system-associated FHA domain protein [Duganella callida]|uniref:type VI secretion system-associated FHA domain protein n=1 Tax=Duganella callida TaxID=2561932 RepID=UPI00197A7B0C|nr:FHA domain-containing protein [Duganella callida]